MSLTDSALCSFSSLAPSLLLEKLWVQQWRGEESLSQPYRFEVRLATINPLFDDETLLGERAVLTLSDEQGVPHPYHGIVTAVDYLDADTVYHYYRVVLEPRITQLRHFRFSEIWLDKDLPELIRDVLKLANLTVEGPGVSGAASDGYDFDIRLPLKDIPMTQAAFTCQFEESSFAFLSRLLEYFGVYYFFEQRVDGEALVLCGDRLYQPKTPSLLTFRRMDSDLNDEPGLAVARTFERKLVRQAAEVTLQDFSASKADLRLQNTASISAATLAVDASPEQFSRLADSAAFFGEQGLYGEHFGSGEQGQWLAVRRAQAIGCRHREFHGSGRAANLRAGHPVLLAGHPRLSFNATYQVIEVHHQGYQPLPGLGQSGEMESDVATSFIALPSDVQFRTPSVTPKPRVQGLLSAIVDGDENSGTPLLNEYGCYKVSFPFIRGEKNATRGSAWVRMASMSSGANHGMNFPLLKGTEVLVSFLGGDPDRPVITGSVANSENPNKVNVSNATQSGMRTPGGHFIAMDDSASGAMMKMGTPSGNTRFTMGDDSVSGAHLRTDNHLQLASSSYKHEVPGVYSMTMLGGTAPNAASLVGGASDTTQGKGDTGATGATGAVGEAGEKGESAEKKTNPNKLEAHWGPATVEAEYKPSPTVTLELKTALEQIGGSISLLKQELKVLGYALEVSIAGPKTEYGLQIGNKEFKGGHTQIFGAHKSETLSRESIGVMDYAKSGFYIQKSGVIQLSAVENLEIKVGASKLILTPFGITVESSFIRLESSIVQVAGDLLVDGALNVGASGFFGKSVLVENAVYSNNAYIQTLNATTEKSGVPAQPAIPAPSMNVMLDQEEMEAKFMTHDMAHLAATQTVEAAITASKSAQKINKAAIPQG